MSRYVIDDTGKRVLTDMRRKVDELSVTKNSALPKSYAGQQQGIATPLRCVAILTEKGSDEDGKFWKWKIALRNTSTGRWIAGKVGSEQFGETLIADGAAGRVGMVGVIYTVQDEDRPWGYSFAPINPAATLPVKVEKDGGADGNATTAATWTYKVRDLSGVLLKKNTAGDDATAVPLTRPRPAGEMTYQAGAEGFGLAFYDAAGNLKLWDAGEVPTTCT